LHDRYRISHAVPLRQCPLDALPMSGCRTRVFRGTEQKRPSTNVTGGVMVQLHKLFGVLQVDR